jgi:hypothetical protein
VAAVVVGQRSECEPALPIDRLAGLEKVGSAADISGAARRAAAGLLWLLDSGATPAPNALDGLLDAAYEPAAGLPVDERGEPVEAAVGRFAETDVPGLLREIGERRVPLRHIKLASLLVPRDAVLAIEPPDPSRFGAYSTVEWTSRLFREKQGMLVPASRVQVTHCSERRPIDAVRVARACGWGKGETLRELVRSVGR